MRDIEKVQSAGITIECFGIEDFPVERLPELQQVFSKAYYNGHMYEDFVADLADKPDVFQAFLATQEGKIVGVAVVETKPHPFIDYRGFPPVHLKRFTVLPEHRGKGIGKRLLDEAKGFAFNEAGLEVLFGESNEVGALSFYGREGALYLTEVIKSYSRRNSPQENLIFFREFLTNPVFRSYRFPEGNGIQFVFCKSDETARLFRDNGFASKDELLKT